MIHKGIRPEYDLKMLDFKRKIYIEEFPDGRYKIWNKRMLNSGCGGTLKGELKELLGCYYCPRCKEYFSKDQWDVTST